ncbi:MAG TPA: MCE family protein [Amycolatopsis sp.]|uniref:MCE family protein n=1 Tax=Amycolatopsis sp. TaxID=37632 RepID=UPI002B4789B6|nr:MCE family protein [Amycolatopsis sp.]HKS45927.1 MCE family protein [Amycolatopsis sp.]
MRKIAAPLVSSLIFIVITGLATAGLAITIGNTGVGDTDSYSARFTDATSVAVGDDVRISGVRVGQVTGLSIVDQQFARVDFTVERGHTLPANVHAAIRYRNMVGQRYVALEPGTEHVAGVLTRGAEIPLDRTTPAVDLTELFNGFKPLFQALSPNNVNQLSGEIVKVLQGEGGTVEGLLQHTGSLTATLAGRDKVIGQVIDNLNSVLRTINARGDQLSGLISTLQRLVSGLAEDRTAIGDAIDGIGSLVSSTGDLFEQGRQPLKDTIAGLNSLSRNLVTGQSDVDRFLTMLPRKFEAVGGISAYGSWLNFYLCQGIVATDPPQGYTSNAPRCGR